MRKKTAEEAAEDNKMQMSTGGTEDFSPACSAYRRFAVRKAFSPPPQILPRARVYIKFPV